ncbi:MAG: winged helix-turn-helix domain-containing protein [Xanthomonadales bacterium]|nr:hypothetical protein [Xanthomonadales bacterium]MCC6594301.1 winged helix-turn-helix domain-containing protein [Xanthomonadales bacterium]MCE7932032.1 hypothetical protein [Xanthomonadales bacterium PRO6]
MRYRLGEFLLDTQRELLIGPAGVANLRPQAYRLLRFLVERAPALVSRDALMDELWGHHALSPNVIPQTVSELRQALGDDPQQARFIETRHRRGYAFIAPVEILADESPALAVAVAAVPAEGSDPASDRPVDEQPGRAATAGTRAWPRYAVLWLTLGALFLLLAGWAGWIALRPRPGPVVAEVAVNPPGLRLESAPAALGAYFGVYARSSGWILAAPGAAAGPTAWRLAIAADGRWQLRDAAGSERSSGVLPQADVATQAQALLRTLEASIRPGAAAGDPAGWPTGLDARQSLVEAALATAEDRHGDALAAYARLAEAEIAGWPALLHAEALVRSGDWRGAGQRLASLRGDSDRALALQAEILRARVRASSAELLAALTAYALGHPEAIDARLEVLDMQLALAKWPAAADSLEALGAVLGEDAPTLAWRRALWLGAMQPGDAPAAFAWAVQRAREAGDMASLRRAQLALARWQLGRSQLVAAAAALEGLAGDDPEALGLRARLATEQGELALARTQLDSAEAIWRARGLAGEARAAQLGRVEVALRAGEHADALALAETLAAEGERSGDLRLKGEWLEALGRAQTGLGRLEPAAENLQRAIDLAREAGDVASEANARYHLGNVRAHQRRLHEAEQAFRLAAETWRSLRDTRGEALALANLALMAERSGRRADAREAYREALARLEELAIPREIGRVTFNLGISERDLGQLAAAAAHFDAAAAALDQAGAVDIRVLVGAARADLALLQGDPPAAGRALDAVAGLRDQAAWLPRSAWLTAMARVRELAGERDRARELLREARDIRERAAVRVAVLDVDLRLLRLDYAAGASAGPTRLAVEAIESELLRLGEDGYALGASLAALETAWMAGDATDAARRAQALRGPVQSRGTRAQQLQFDWLQALAGEDSLRRGRLDALAQAAEADGFGLLARLVRREMLPPDSPERAAVDRELARDGLAGATRLPAAAF